MSRKTFRKDVIDDYIYKRRRLDGDQAYAERQWNAQAMKMNRNPQRITPPYTLNSVPRTRGAIIQGEMKYYDCFGGGAIADNTGDWSNSVKDPSTTVNIGGNAAVPTPGCLFAPTAGTGIDQRIGKAVHVMKIKINFLVLIAAQTTQTVADPATPVRLILVMDKQTNKATITGDQLMQEDTTTVGGLLTFQNVNNFGRFQVLKDKTYVMHSPTLTVLSGTTIEQSGIGLRGKMSYTFRTPLRVRFDGSAGTVADIIDNSFHMLATTSSAALVPTLYYRSRVTFKE